MSKDFILGRLRINLNLPIVGFNFLIGVHIMPFSGGGVLFWLGPLQLLFVSVDTNLIGPDHEITVKKTT